MSLKRLFLRVIVPWAATAVVVWAAIVLGSGGGHAGWPIIWAAGAAAVLCAGGVMFRRRNWSLPMRRMEQAAAHMALGEWNIRVQPHGAGRARRLAANLNLLAAQAQKQLADLQQQRAGLQALVDTLPDPILAADAQGRMILLNVPATRLLSVFPAQVIGQKLISVVNDESIIELYEALLDTPKPVAPLHKEVRLMRGGQKFIFQAVAVRSGGGGALLVLRDVSTLAGAVQMKTDFVANASHELRTPIAAIKIAFETLREVYREDPAQTDRCVTVIDGQIRRLEEMLRDLLDLSRVETADLKPHVASIKTVELLAQLKATLGPLARQKNVELRLADQEPATPEEFSTDTRLLNLVLKNLMENSIKFTPPGGKVTVSIRRDEEDGNVTIVVADTGIGIAKEHLDRVFERFYQVDSARSGSAGRGTGLGLAIVKHAVAALGGTVHVESTVGVGTTVTCEFPKSGGAAGPRAQIAVA